MRDKRDAASPPQIEMVGEELDLPRIVINGLVDERDYYGLAIIAAVILDGDERLKKEQEEREKRANRAQASAWRPPGSRL